MTVQKETELDTHFDKYTIRVSKEELCDLTNEQMEALRSLENEGLSGIMGALYLLAVAHDRKVKEQRIIGARAALERKEERGHA